MAFVETDIQDQIMIIKLNRPDRLNALSEVIREGMSEAFTKFEKDSNLEVAILTGEGRGFCAGEDMKESLERGDVGSRSGKVFRDPFMERTLEKPVIGAINGPALGGGLVMAACCDYLIGSTKAQFGLPQIWMGGLGGGGHAFRIFPQGLARSMQYTGEYILSLIHI